MNWLDSSRIVLPPAVESTPADAKNTTDLIKITDRNGVGNTRNFIVYNLDTAHSATEKTKTSILKIIPCIEGKGLLSLPAISKAIGITALDMGNKESEMTFLRRGIN